MFVSMMMSRISSRQMLNSQYEMMRGNMARMSMCRNLPFGGNLESIKAMDNKMAMDMDTNNTLYLLASAQKKACDAMMAQDIKNNKISYIA